MGKRRRSIMDAVSNNVEQPLQSDEQTARRQAPYLVFVLLISVLALLLLAVDAFISATSETRRILQYADVLLCALFFVDFLVCLGQANNRVHYILTWGWLDLLSSIPAVEVFRWGRAARLARILRVLRGVRSARILMRLILERRAQSVGLAAALASIVVIAISSIAILQLEASAGENANIRNAEDAIWWSIVTITTVGYGDHYPVTMEGRCVAIVLMICGIALIGTWAGIATSWFMGGQQEDIAAKFEKQLEEIRRLVNDR